MESAPFRAEVAKYFEVTTLGTTEVRRKQIQWRTACFDQGTELGRYVQEVLRMPLGGKRVLDVACGWGGHALSPAEQGARVVAADLTDFSFATLTEFSKQRGIDLTITRCNCEALAFTASSFDLVLALELVEHIPNPQNFANELARVLSPGGIGIVSTPPRLRSFLFGEPHYGLRGITALPLRWQSTVARRVFLRRYPFPIERQYLTAFQVLRPFRRAGLEGRAVQVGRMESWFRRLRATGLGATFLWNFLIVRKGGTR